MWVNILQNFVKISHFWNCLCIFENPADFFFFSIEISKIQPFFFLDHSLPQLVSLSSDAVFQQGHFSAINYFKFCPIFRKLNCNFENDFFFENALIKYIAASPPPSRDQLQITYEKLLKMFFQGWIERNLPSHPCPVQIISSLDLFWSFAFTNRANSSYKNNLWDY